VTDLVDDTQLILALRTEDADPARDPLGRISLAVVTKASLQAKAQAYEMRVTRAMAEAANQGAGLTELADAAGTSIDEVRERLSRHPELLEPSARDRLLAPVRHRRW